MGIERVFLAFVITLLGAWGVVAFGAREGAPGCVLGVLGFWTVSLIGTASDDLAVGVAAFLGMIAGVGLAVATMEADVRRS